MLKNFEALNLKNFHLKTLVVKSKALKGNPLKDPSLRENPVLVPKQKGLKDLPVVLLLAGFGGNGQGMLNWKSFEKNTVEQIDACASAGKAPLAVYVLVDAWTFWGGSQFINSSAVGNYEDYIVQDLLPALQKALPVSRKARDYCVTGTSSGGYGALHLSSKYPQHFGYCAALAPDSFFAVSALGDIYKSANYLVGVQKVDDLKKRHAQGELQGLKDFFPILNTIAMSACYSPRGKTFDFPVDFHSGLLKPAIWKKWLAHDPLEFLPKRLGKLKRLQGIYIDVGSKDEFKLHYGCRQMHQLLKKAKIPHQYSEFNGGHFDFAKRRHLVWEWLALQWEK